jgi:hypothetical protein
MAALPSGWNANEQKETGGFQPIPAGTYVACITASEDKATASGNGRYYKLEWQVLEGPHKGRKLWSNHNYINPSQTAQEIGLGEMAAICKAAGKPQAKDTCELHNIALAVVVKVDKRSDSDELTNVIKGFKARGSVPAVADSSSAPPWKR